MTGVKAMFAMLAAVTVAVAQTVISGNLGDMTLDSTGNPFIVEKDITVPKGKSLIIKEGCAMLFKQFTGLTIQGICTANGTKEHPVVFTSINDVKFNKTAAQEAGSFDWNGITVDKKSKLCVFNCIDVKYSVYGIKSQNPQLVIRQSTFNQNGQFHFTINEKIQNVQENQPFSYNDRPQTETGSPENAGLSQKTKIIRYGSLGVGAGGTVAGVIMSIKASSDYSHWKHIEKEDIQPGEYEKRRDVYHSSLTWALILDILGGLGLGGFGLTFAF